MEKENEVLETVQVEHGKKGKSTIKNHGKMKDGKLLLPLKKNGKIKMVTQEEVAEVIEESQDAKFERLAKEALETKPRVRNHDKVKFVSNGTTVDVVEKEDPPKPRPVASVFVKDLVESFSGLCTVDTDKNGFTNFRTGKFVEFYATDRVGGFIALSVRDDNAKSGWRTDRVITKLDLDDAISTLKAQIQNKTKFTQAYIPYYHCPECEFVTQSKTEMTAHVGTHISGD